MTRTVLWITGEAQSGKTSALIALAKNLALAGPIAYVDVSGLASAMPQELRKFGMPDEVSVIRLNAPWPSRPFRTLLVDEADRLTADEYEELMRFSEARQATFSRSFVVMTGRRQPLCAAADLSASSPVLRAGESISIEKRDAADLRLECMKLAVGHDDLQGDMIARAARMAHFVIGGRDPGFEVKLKSAVLSAASDAYHSSRCNPGTDFHSLMSRLVKDAIEGVLSERS